MEHRSSTNAKIESNPRSSSDLSWQVMFRSASFRRPNSSPPSHVITRSVSFRQPISTTYETSYSPLQSSPYGQPSQLVPRLSTDSQEDSSDEPQEPDPTNDFSWKSMFRSASFRMPSSSPLSSINHSLSPENQQPHVPHQPSPDTPESQLNNNVESYSASSVAPWQDMFQTASLHHPNATAQPDTSFTDNHVPPRPQEPNRIPSLRGDPLVFHVAIYTAMANVGFALALFLLYNIYHLIKEYVQPIKWAVLCSIPLRGIQRTLVGFWSEPLRLGLTETLLAVPLTVLRAVFSTLFNIRDVWFSIVLNQTTTKMPFQNQSGFLKLVQMLLSFGIFVLAYGQTGSVGSLSLLGLSFMSMSFLESTVSIIYSCRSRSTGCSISSLLLREMILKHLKSLVAIGLIFGMVIGLLASIIFFSFKIAGEGKDVVIILKNYVEDSKFAEQIGIKKWIDENVTQAVEWYASQLQDSVTRHLDSWANGYDLTEFFNEIKHFLKDPPENEESQSPLMEKLQSLMNQFRNQNWGNVFKETETLFWELQFGRMDFVEKAKGFFAQGLDVSQHAFASSIFYLTGSAKLVFSIGHSVLYTAIGLLNFGLQWLIFIWVLYFLITSESGGFTEQVIGMLPIPKSARTRYIEVLNTAISGVILATAEISFFQGCFTWILFKLYSIHFLYVSTLLAFISPLVPIFPTWLSTIPAAIQLVLEKRYLLAISLSIIHLVLMDYGASEIIQDIPGYNTYLTGFSIIGGLALFPSVIEGVIMGPLITTGAIALKDLYSEFVADEPNESQE